MKLIAEQLASIRGGRTLFSGLSFAVARGEALIVTGANGAGKTTLIRTIAGFAAPDAGVVRLAREEEDAPRDGVSRLISEQAHYVGHLNGVKANLSVEENAAFWCGFLGKGDKARVPAALEAFALARLRDIPAGYLSAGQKRRLALARLLLAERPIWLIDEPTTSLDSEGQAMLAGAVDRHLASGGLVVAATHAPLAFANARELRLGGTAAAGSA